MNTEIEIRKNTYTELEKRCIYYVMGMWFSALDEPLEFYEWLETDADGETIFSNTLEQWKDGESCLCDKNEGYDYCTTEDVFQELQGEVMYLVVFIKTLSKDGLI